MPLFLGLRQHRSAIDSSRTLLFIFLGRSMLVHLHYPLTPTIKWTYAYWLLVSTAHIHSNLGTSPISSVPYSFSFISFHMTVGTLTVLMHIVMILLQMLIFKFAFSGFSGCNYLLALLFGVFIDGLMWLTQGWSIESYPLQLTACLASCLITPLAYACGESQLCLFCGEGYTKPSHVRYPLIWHCKLMARCLVTIAVSVG